LLERRPGHPKRNKTQCETRITNRAWRWQKTEKEMHMSDVPVQVVIAAFKDEKAADQALLDLKTAKWAGLIGIQNAAVLRRDEKNKLHIKETGDWGGGKGAAAGAVLGGFVGLLAGPVGWLGLTGAVIGGLAPSCAIRAFPTSAWRPWARLCSPARRPSWPSSSTSGWPTWRRR
jgi:hypothetical protein